MTPLDFIFHFCVFVTTSGWCWRKSDILLYFNASLHQKMILIVRGFVNVYRHANQVRLRGTPLAALQPNKYRRYVIMHLWNLKWGHPFRSGLYFTASSTSYNPRWKTTGSPRLLVWLNSSRANDSWYISFILEPGVRRFPLSHQQTHAHTHTHTRAHARTSPPPGPVTAHRAQRQEMEQRDATAQHETGTKTLPPTLSPFHSLAHTKTHTHTHICTDVPNPPRSPICFLTCHSQRRFSAKLPCISFSLGSSLEQV